MYKLLPNKIIISKFQRKLFILHMLATNFMSREETRRQEKSLFLLKTSFQFLSLADVATEGLILQKNNNCIVTDSLATEEEFMEKTKYGDFNIGIAILFNLYHGIELLLKGFLLIKGFQLSKHNLKRLRVEFEKRYPEEEQLNYFFNRYINDDHLPLYLNEFLTANKLEFGGLYEALRYPLDKNLNWPKIYDPLIYSGNYGYNFFSELHDDLEKAFHAAVKLRNKEIDG